jgi:catechol 2,3-dioxygenase-like lactoylglutathione lyase family enzyme
MAAPLAAQGPLYTAPTPPLEPGEALPVAGLAQVTVDVQDLAKARDFYARIGGFEEAFDTKKADGALDAAFFKVNDRQFIEVRQGRPTWQTIWHFALQTKDIGRTRSWLVDHGLKPGEIGTRADGNRSFRLEGLPGQQLSYIEFLEYEPDSLSERTHGQFLGSRRMSDHLEHVGIVVTDFPAAYRFFKSFGFRDRFMRLSNDESKDILDQLYIPGTHGAYEFVELFNFTGSPQPITHKVAKGAVHFAFTVPDDAAAAKEIVARGVPGKHPPPRYAWDNRYNTNIFDPDGTRVEFMQVEDPQRPTPLVVYTPKP